MAKERYFYFGGIGAILFYLGVFMGFMYLIAEKNRTKDESVVVSIAMDDIPEVLSQPLTNQPTFQPQQKVLPTLNKIEPVKKTSSPVIKAIDIKTIGSTPLNLANIGVKSLTLPSSVPPVKLNKPSPKVEDKNITQPRQKAPPLSVKLNLAKATPLQLNKGKASSAQLAKLSSMIYEQWVPAAGEEGLSAKIGIKSTPQGTIQVRLAGSSGDPKFDQKLMAIVNKLDYDILFPDKTAVDVVVSFKVKGN
jgi:hypothetical protein